MNVLLVLCLGSFSLLVSYTISVMSGVLLFLQKQYTLTLLQKQLLVSVILLGALGGVALAGPLSDRYGRKWALVAGAFFYIAGSLLSVLTNSIDGIIWSRIVTGVGVGISSVVIPLYIGEIAKIEKRGARIALFQLAVTLGILLSYLVNWAVSGTADWKIPFMVSLALSLLGGGTLFFLPESPAWLFIHHQKKKAAAVLHSLDADANKNECSKGAKKSSGVQIVDLFRKGLLSNLLIAILLSIFQQATGINTLIYYAPTIFTLAGYTSLSSSLFVTLLIGIINVIVTIAALFWIDRFGRRRLLLIGLPGMTVSLCALFLWFSTGIVAVTALMAYVVFFAFSLGPVVWVIVAEIFPLRFRGKAVSLAVFINWLANYLLSFSFLGLIAKMGLKETYLLFACVSAIAFLFVYFFVPETKGKSVDSFE